MDVLNEERLTGLLPALALSWAAFVLLVLQRRYWKRTGRLKEARADRAFVRVVLAVAVVGLVAFTGYVAVLVSEAAL